MTIPYGHVTVARRAHARNLRQISESTLPSITVTGVLCPRVMSALDLQRPHLRHFLA